MYFFLQLKTGNKRDWQEWEKGPKPPKQASVSFPNDGLKTGILVADSFGRYIMDDGLLGNQVNMFEPVYECDAGPHDVNRISSDVNKFRMVMHCYGGLKLKECMTETLATKIMFVKPQCLIFMLGMCDLSKTEKNGYVPDKKWFFETMMEVKMKFNELTQDKIENEADARYRREVIFHFATLQNWGDAWTPSNERYISKDEVKKLRRKNVTFAQTQQGHLWQWHRILLVDLNVHPCTRRDSIHYI